MTHSPEQLTGRLDGIAAALAATGSVRALLAFGSAGGACGRLDRFSDLDFLVVVRDGEKGEILDDLAWLSASSPLIYHYRHTPDGIKALSADGILYDFGVVESRELNRFPHEGGRIIWSDGGFDPALAQGNLSRFPETASECSIEWHLGEIITALYTGLCRYGRGEKLSAFKLIQGTALDRYLALLDQTGNGASSPPADPFDPARRAEARFPGREQEFQTLAPGLAHTPAAAEAILRSLSARFSVAPPVRRLLEALIAAGEGR